MIYPRSSCNYLQIEGHGPELLDDSLEILASSSLPQGRSSAVEYENRVLAWAACGWKCPVKSCIYTVQPYPGKSIKFQHDKAGRLERLECNPVSRENAIFNHWEHAHFFPYSACCRLFEGAMSILERGRSGVQYQVYAEGIGSEASHGEHLPLDGLQLL